ncbi:MAG: hypothetical protein J3T61_01240 [Candidatus Brocadiales bacterium]|nr:hypothetical protein [Candidatus Bathyanammoxibius sp.]
MIFPSWLLALFLVQAPFQPAPDKMICWDNVVLTRDFISWTAWDCQANDREKALGPKTEYKIVHGSGAVTIAEPGSISRFIPIPGDVEKHLLNDLSHILDILGQAHRNSHRAPSPKTTNAPVKI